MLAVLPLTLLRRSLLPCLLLPIVSVSAALVNRTIDDTIGDSTTGLNPTYSPSNAWAQGQQCSTCNIHSGTTPGTIDIQQVFDATWHDSTYHPGDPEHTVAVSFTGSAVYVYNIIANQMGGTTTFTNLTFWIDGELVGNYIHAPESTPPFEYGVLVYSNTSLENKLHFLTMGAGGANASLILFDRIVYTQDDSTSPSAFSSPNSTVPTSFSGSTTTPSSSVTTSKPSPPIGAIVGGVVGGVAGLTLLGLIAFCIVCRRRREAARRPPPAAEKIDPFVLGGARRPPAQRMSRAPILPDLRFGRLRLMPRSPGSTTTTTDASSSTETGDGFRGHRPRLPPMSPAEAARSQEQLEYVARIQALEAQVRALEVQQQLGPGGTSSDASGSRTQLSHGSPSTPRTRRSRSGHRSGRSGRSANASSANLRSELTSLRNEIAALRGELTQDQLGVLGAAPSYVS